MNKSNISGNVATAVTWVGLSAAVIYGIKKTGSLLPLFAFVLAPYPMFFKTVNKEVSNGTD